jgi:hypothetical protein
MADEYRSKHGDKAGGSGSGLKVTAGKKGGTRHVRF